MLTASSAESKAPCSSISRAARRNAPSAPRDKALPTLTRRTPISERIAGLHRTPPSPITTLTGQSTDFTTDYYHGLLVE
jgi:hypothetical protein